MKMIDVLNMMSKNEIKEGTKLKYGYKIYNYVKDYTDSENCSFVSQEDDRNELLEDNELITTDFLNSEVELIPPKEKKYLIMLNVRGLRPTYNYLNYYNNGIKPWVLLGDEEECEDFRTHFTKNEMQSIQPVREFLEDMKDKYELVEVKENEDD